MQKKECPICKSALIQSRPPVWDKAHHEYAIFYCRCDKCCVDITFDHGIISVFDKKGVIVLSGK